MYPLLFDVLVERINIVLPNVIFQQNELGRRHLLDKIGIIRLRYDILYRVYVCISSA